MPYMPNTYVFLNFIISVLQYCCLGTPIGSFSSSVIQCQILDQFGLSNDSTRLQVIFERSDDVVFSQNSL